MSRYTGGELDRVRTASTIKRHGQSDKTFLELLHDLKEDQ